MTLKLSTFQFWGSLCFCLLPLFLSLPGKLQYSFTNCLWMKFIRSPRLLHFGQVHSLLWTSISQTVKWKDGDLLTLTSFGSMRGSVTSLLVLQQVPRVYFSMCRGTSFLQTKSLFQSYTPEPSSLVLYIFLMQNTFTSIISFGPNQMPEIGRIISISNQQIKELRFRGCKWLAKVTGVMEILELPFSGVLRFWLSDFWHDMNQYAHNEIQVSVEELSMRSATFLFFLSWPGLRGP